MSIISQKTTELKKAERLKNDLWKNAFRTQEDRQIFNKAHERVLNLQREIAQLENKAFCKPLDGFNFLWDTGAPLPHLVQNEHKTFLLYFLKKNKSDWDGKSVEVISLSETESLIAAIEFKRCQTTRFGAPNDETLDGHPLYGRGLDYYEPFIVEHSDWIKELEKINSVHSNHSSKYYEKYKHYLFAFHDSIFECVATEFEVKVLNSTMKNAYLEYSQKLF